MSVFTEKLYELQDVTYADFQAGLVPTLGRERFIGVRMPAMRNLVKQLKKSEAYETDAATFFREVPHDYYEENILHALLVSEIADYEKAVEETEAFLPYVDNWAVCDIFKPKPFKKEKNRKALLEKIRIWSASEHVYTCRFGMEMLMNFFLDEAFEPEYLEIPASVHSDEYYVNMMIAWFFATALAKQWEATVPYIEQHRLDDWTHRKSITKANESFRITAEQKNYLKTFRS